MESSDEKQPPKLSEVLDDIGLQNSAGRDEAYYSFLIAEEMARLRLEFQPGNYEYRCKKAIASGQLAIYKTKYIIKPAFSNE